MVLDDYGRRDVETFSPRRVAVVPNGIPDPCPDFESSLLRERLRRRGDRMEPRAGQPPPFELLYLAHATRTKGLFDTVDAVAAANARLAAEKSLERIRLTVAGAFVDREEEAAFRERLQRDDLALATEDGPERAVVYAGYVEPKEKDRLLRTCDALCFASHFPNEGQPVSIIEALAYGMPVLLSRWRGLPGMVPSPLAHLAEPRDAASVAMFLPLLFDEGRFAEFRQVFLDRYSLASHCRGMREAILVGRPAQRGGLGALDGQRAAGLASGGITESICEGRSKDIKSGDQHATGTGAEACQPGFHFFIVDGPDFEFMDAIAFVAKNFDVIAHGLAFLNVGHEEVDVTQAGELARLPVKHLRERLVGVGDVAGGVGDDNRRGQFGEDILNVEEDAAGICPVIGQAN